MEEELKRMRLEIRDDLEILIQKAVRLWKFSGGYQSSPEGLVMKAFFEVEDAVREMTKGESHVD